MASENRMKEEPQVYEVDDHSNCSVSDGGATQDEGSAMLQSSDLDANFHDWAYSVPNKNNSFAPDSDAPGPSKVSGEIEWPGLIADNMQSCVCLICHKNFASDSSLKSHMLVHTGERRYRCEFCNNGFKLKHHLQRHILMHVRIHLRKYGGSLMCIGCTQSFLDEMDMAKHMSDCQELKLKASGFKSSLREKFSTFIGDQETEPHRKASRNLKQPCGETPTSSDCPLGRSAQDPATQQFLDRSPVFMMSEDSSVSSADTNTPKASVPFLSSLPSPQVLGYPNSNSYYAKSHISSTNASSSTGNAAGSHPQRIIGTNTLTGLPITIAEQKSSQPNSTGGAGVLMPYLPPAHYRTIGVQTLESGTSAAQQFTCVACNIDFGENALYLMHKMLHGQDSPWQCSQCGENFPDKYGFMAHMLNRMSHN